MKRRLFTISCLGAVVAVPLVLAGQSKPMTAEEMHKLHQDPKAYIALLDDPARDAYQKPHEVVMRLEIKEGERIADIGAGSGYFSMRFANHVGDRGQVLAVDINPDMIIIDCHKKPTPVGPPVEMRAAREDVVTEFTQAGFRLAREHDILPYQYFLVLVPASPVGR